MSNIDTLPDEVDSMQTFKDLFAGAAGGIAQVLIGQPFDIVKVRLQTTTNYKSALDCATKIYTNEGLLAFYKGTMTPLIGIGACVSVQFGAFHSARRYFEAQNIASASKSSASNPSGTLSMSQFYLAGAFAGVTNSVLSCPIEHVRIRLQTQPHGAERLYAGPFDCIKTIVRQGGLLNGLFRGQAVTVLREAQAFGVWFLTYEYLMQADVARRNLPGRDSVETWRLAFYGGIAGEMLWLASYPLDVIKSKMQTDGLGPASASRPIVAAAKSATATAINGHPSANPPTNGGWEFGKPATEAAYLREAAQEDARVRATYTEHGVELGKTVEASTAAAANNQSSAAKAAAEKQFGARKYATMRSAFASTYRTEGIAGFWRGIGPTLVRAMPVSAATFAVAEATLRAIS